MTLSKPRTGSRYEDLPSWVNRTGWTSPRRRAPSSLPLALWLVQCGRGWNPRVTGKMGFGPARFTSQERWELSEQTPGRCDLKAARTYAQRKGSLLTKRLQGCPLGRARAGDRWDT